MGSLLEIIGNHQLKFTSAQAVIDQFESALNVRINNGTYQSVEVQNKHTDAAKIEYFTAYDFLEQNFNTYKEVRILTNYQYCSELNIHGQTLSYSNGCAYKYWIDVLLEEEQYEDRKSQYAFCKAHWAAVHKYAHHISKLIGGDQLMFFNDDRFQDEIDLCFQGKSLDAFLAAARQKWEPTELQEALNRKDEFMVRHGWYFEKIPSQST